MSSNFTATHRGSATAFRDLAMVFIVAAVACVLLYFLNAFDGLKQWLLSPGANWLQFGGLVVLFAVLTVASAVSSFRRERELKAEVARRRQIEKALEQSEERYRTMFETTGTATIIIEEDTTISLAKAEFERLFGYSKEELEGKKSWTELIVKDDLGKMQNWHRLRRVDPDAAPSSYEFRGFDKQGDVRHCLLSIAMIPGTKKSVASILDISERKRMEEQQLWLLKDLENSYRELNQLIYVASHDLKAPLRAVGCLANWLSTDYANKLDKDGKELIELLFGRVKRMDNLVDGILQYLRVGRVKEKKVPVNLDELVTDVIESLTLPAHISIGVDASLPTIVCEKTRVQQVFQNLLDNAVKFMDKPKGEVRVACRRDDGYWKFSVSDNGPGIEEKHFKRIFQIFQALSPRDNFEGTGIGLTVAKKIVEAQGGRIWVESKVGDGSTFYFTLPV